MRIIRLRDRIHNALVVMSQSTGKGGRKKIVRSTTMHMYLKVILNNPER